MKTRYLIPMILLACASGIFSCATIIDSVEVAETAVGAYESVGTSENDHVELLYADVSIEALLEVADSIEASGDQNQSKLYIDEIELESNAIGKGVDEQHQSYYDVPLSEALQDYIFAVGEQYHVPAAMIIAIIDTESGFSANEVSETNDYGLMQVN